MHIIALNPRLDRQLVPDGPAVLWRDGEAGRRDGLLVVLQPCPFPDCPDRHVDLILYRLDDAAVELEVEPLEARAIARDGAIRGLDPFFTASVELDDDRLEADADAPPDVVAWLDREIHGALMPGLREQFRRARARTEAIFGTFPPRAREPVGRNERCPCGSGRKYERCCLGAA